MKFYALVLISRALAKADDEALRAAVRERLQPYGQAHCEALCQGHRWDYSWCCDKTWLGEEGFDLTLYPRASSAHELLLFPIEDLTEEGVPAVLLTPDGEWHESAATLRSSDPLWPARVMQLCSRYSGYMAVLVYAHR